MATEAVFIGVDVGTLGASKSLWAPLTWNFHLALGRSAKWLAQRSWS